MELFRQETLRMTLTAILIMLGLMTISVQPMDPLQKDDQTMATCAAAALTERPSALKVVGDDVPASVKLVVSNETKFRLHAVGRLVRPDGTTIIEVDHVQRGFNHTLCNQVKNLVDKMAQRLVKERPRVGQ